MVGTIINRELTSLAILRYLPHCLLISSLNLSVWFGLPEAPYAYDTRVSRPPLRPYEIAKQRIFKMMFPKPIPLIIWVVFSIVSISLYPANEMKNALIITVNLKESIETT